MRESGPSTKGAAITRQPLYDITKIQAHVTDELAVYFSARTNRAMGLAVRYGELWQILTDVVMRGGKRFRPYLMLAAYQMYGKPLDASVIRAACAYELLHQGLLIHDDFIDYDYTRHGRLNVSGQLREQYRTQSAITTTDSEHLADSMAILAGDAAIGAAYDVLRRSGLPAEAILHLQGLLDEALFTTIGGEMLDSESPVRPIAETDVLAIARLKTATYSCIAPIVSGAQLAGASSKELDALRVYGEHVGIAYQLADDVLGVFGDEAVTGKSVISDIEEGKHTLLLQYAWEHVSAADKTLLRKLVGTSGLSKHEADQVRSIFMRSGAHAAAEAHIREQAETALGIVDTLTASDDGKEALRDFVRRATQRLR